MSEIDHEVNHLQNQFVNILNEINTLEARKTELDEKRKYALESAGNQEKAKELKRMLEEARYEYEDRRKRMQDMRTDLELMRKKQEQAESEIAACEEETQQASLLFHRLSNRRDILENIIKQPFTHQMGVKAVMQAQTTLHGVMGVVSQIFKPMMNYESAIGSALGGALYHIVTEDETSARHAITFLKKNQSGRATFLPMNVLKPRYIGRDHRMLCENSVGFWEVRRNLSKMSRSLIRCAMRYWAM